MENKRCALYCRVSTPQQGKTGISMGEQEQQLRDYAKAMAWDVIGVYLDPGFSGSLETRPQLQLLFTDLRRKHIDVVLCWRIDRWSRKVSHWYKFYEILDQNHTALAFIEPQLNTGDEMGRLFMGLLAWFAEMEAKADSERTTNIINSAKHSERYLPRPPYGLVKDGRAYTWESPESRAAVEDIYRRVREGQSQRTMSRDLCMTRDAVRGIVANPIYAGQIATTRRDNSGHGTLINWQQLETYAVPFVHPSDQIISWTDWYDLQRAEESMSHSGERSGQLLFSKLFYCATDHHLLTGKGAQGKHKDVVKYVCESDSRKEHPLPSCHHDVLQHHLEGAIASALKDELLRANMTQGISVEEQQLDTILAKTRKATENIRKHLYASDRWDDSVKADLDAKDAQLEDLLERKKEYEDAHTTIEAIRQHIEQWDGFYGALTTDEKRQLFHATIKQIAVDFGHQRATVAWTFSSATAEINIAYQKSAYLSKIRQERKHAIDEGLDGQKSKVVEIGGLEPPTSCMPCRRSPS